MYLLAKEDVMKTQKDKKTWKKPELTVIDRLHKEESVLLQCNSSLPLGNPQCPIVEQTYNPTR